MRYVCLSLLSLFIYSCGYSLVSNNPSKLDAVLIFENTPLNKLLVINIKSNQGYLGLNLSKTDQVDLKIRIISQRIGKFLSATDKNLTPAVGSIEYSLEYEFILDDKIISQSFYDSELYPYNTSNILSNDKITKEIKNSFLDKALDDIKFNLIKISNG
jgi:hypothetical protein